MPFLIKTGNYKYKTHYPLIVNKKDGSVLVKVPGGEFEMGDGEDDNCPKHVVHVDSFYMGVYCVTNRQYKQFVDETGHRAPDKLDYSGNTPIWKGKNYPAEYADHPVVCVSWDDALAYCKWSGLRLPTEAEWEKAARGPKNYKYPWGNKYDEEKCRNDNNKGDETTSPVYGYPEGISGYGLYNMSGNVWEWCGDRYGESYYKKSPKRNPTGPKTGPRRVLRGGGWNGSDAAHLRCSIRYGGVPSRRDDRQGFRAVLPAG